MAASEHLSKAQFSYGADASQVKAELAATKARWFYAATALVNSVDQGVSATLQKHPQSETAASKNEMSGGH